MAVTRTRPVGFFLFSVSALLPTAVSAQSAIAGMVRDASGRIMPNVTVEAASPALIEKSRAVVTNAEGCYTIVDLRPGTWTLTFMAPGFKVTRRDGIDVPADTTVPLNVDMDVGSVGEIVEVQAHAPVVDVQSTAHTIIQDREFMDQIPSSRTFQQLAGLTPCIRLTTPDVGGSQHMEQTYVQGMFLGRSPRPSCSTVCTRIPITWTV
jgi:hypothetical protein